MKYVFFFIPVSVDFNKWIYVPYGLMDACLLFYAPHQPWVYLLASVIGNGKFILPFWVRHI